MTTLTDSAPQTTAPPAVVMTVVGLESLGPVKVLRDAVPLGVPSFENETTYAPFEGVQIVVPAGAWVSDRRRSAAAPRPLTITVFELPAGLAVPGAPCGPALDLGPHDQQLALPILISVPCGASAGLVRRVYALDPAGRAWAADGSSDARDDGETVWGETQTLGAHAGMLFVASALAPFPPPPQADPAVATPQPAVSADARGMGASTKGVVIGATLGAAAVLAMAGAAVWQLRLHRRGPGWANCGEGGVDEEAGGGGGDSVMVGNRRVSVSLVFLADVLEEGAAAAAAAKAGSGDDGDDEGGGLTGAVMGVGQTGSGEAARAGSTEAVEAAAGPVTVEVRLDRGSAGGEIDEAVLAPPGGEIDEVVSAPAGVRTAHAAGGDDAGGPEPGPSLATDRCLGGGDDGTGGGSTWEVGSLCSVDHSGGPTERGLEVRPWPW